METTPVMGPRPGTRQTEIYRVEETHSALQVGSGSVPVLATPWLIAFMERTAHRLVVAALPAGFTSVGVQVAIHHLAPTPVGGLVTVTAEVQEAAGRRFQIALQAWDDVEKIGEGIHERVVVNTDRFLEKLRQKLPEP